jgi:hypothetical protein
VVFSTVAGAAGAAGPELGEAGGDGAATGGGAVRSGPAQETTVSTIKASERIATKLSRE